MALVNGTAYSWSQIKLNILGVNPVGVTAISYNETEEMEDNMGLGNRPVSRGYGGIETEGSITMHMEEVESLQDASPTGRIQDIPEFDIVVSFLPRGGVIRTHVLKNCRFKTNGRDMSQGDMAIEVECELQIAEIKWK